MPSPRSLAAMLQSFDNDAKSVAKTPRAPDIQAELLRDALRSYLTKHEFTAGMIVRQKPACPIYADTEDLWIVTEILATPLVSDGEFGSPHWNEPIDMITGICDSSGDFVTFHVDSRRFEPVPLDEITLPGDTPRGRGGVDTNIENEG